MILDHRATLPRQPAAVSTWSSREPDLLLLLFLLFRPLHLLFLLQGKKNPFFRWMDRLSFVPRERATDSYPDRLLVRLMGKVVARDNPILPSRNDCAMDFPGGGWKIGGWLFERKTRTTTMTMMTTTMTMTTTTMNGRTLIEAEDEEA